jgi:Tol biopolymer transport system component
MKRLLVFAAALLSLGVGGRPAEHGQLLVEVGDPSRLAVVDVASGHVRRIAPGHSVYDATWSPDGKRILFTDGHVYVVGADGRHLRRLTHERLAEHDAAWSPDGSRVAYLRQLPPAEPYPPFGPEDDLMVLDLRSGTVTQLTHDPRSKGELRWAPDGRRIVYQLHGHVGVTAVVLDVATGESTIVGGYPQFSPDGREIAYVDADRITLSDANGANRRVLLKLGHDRQFGGLSWSPDGRKLAVDYEGGGWRLTEIVDIATGRMHPLQPIDRRSPRGGWRSTGGELALGRGRRQFDGGASWSPDGRLIAFVGFDFHVRPHTPELVVVRSDGKALRILWRSRHGFGVPQWRPHH